MPRVAMFASCAIAEGEELFWDYFCKLNPARCLIDSRAEIVPPELQWVYCKRTKTGELNYCPPKKSRSNRGGKCIICYAYKKQLSNHLISYHKILSSKKRSAMIKRGRKDSNCATMVDGINACGKKQVRRSLLCPFCCRLFKQLPIHLSRVHHLEKEKRTKIVQSSKKKMLEKERRERKINMTDQSY